MCPVILHKDGAVLLVSGSPGGRTIPSTVLGTVLNVVDFGMDARAAVDAPRFHHQWLPDRIQVEATLPLATREALKATLRGEASAALTQALLVVSMSVLRLETAMASKSGPRASPGTGAPVSALAISWFTRLTIW